MRALVVYESMFGNTRRCAEAVASGLAVAYEANAIRVNDVSSDDLEALDLLVVGGPTHAWGMSRPNSRQGAAGQAAQPARNLTLEPGATGTGLREWLGESVDISVDAAAFDTRMKLPRLVTGAAAPKIARGLRQRGCRLVSKPMSFLVTRSNLLVPGEEARAHQWGAQLVPTAHAGSREHG